MFNNTQHPDSYRNTVYLAIVVFYLLPVSIFGASCLSSAGAQFSWLVVAFGGALTALGGALLIALIKRWEGAMSHYATQLVDYKVKRFQAEFVPEQDPVEGVVSKQMVVEDQPVYVAPRPSQLEEQIHLLQGTLREKEDFATEMSRALERKNEELKRVHMEREEMIHQLQEADEEKGLIKREFQEQINQKESLLGEYSQTITEQRSIIEKKQSSIVNLEGKVRDLSYEVRTLLQLEDIQNQSVAAVKESREQPQKQEIPQIKGREGIGAEDLHQNLPISSDKEVRTHYDAFVQLQKSIQTAQDLTGALHLAKNSPSRFLDVSVDSYAIDLRRLFDSLRSENTCVILVYSQTEDKLLFVNNQIKTLLGWGPERFVKDFFSIVQKGMAEWRQSVKTIQDQSAKQVRLALRAKSGQDVLVQCCLGVVPNGAFKGYIIGVIYPG